VAAVGPTSAMICCAESAPSPGTSASGCTASWCGCSKHALEAGVGDAGTILAAVRRQMEGSGPMRGKLNLAQAKSNRGPRGRKNDFGDGERLLKRLVAGEADFELRTGAGTTPVADG
jgi:hypothetical protein